MDHGRAKFLQLANGQYVDKLINSLPKGQSSEVNTVNGSAPTELHVHGLCSNFIPDSGLILQQTSSNYQNINESGYQ